MDEIRLPASPDYINKLIATKGVDTNLISDGYHTFGELYEHRIELYIALCKMIDKHCCEFTSPVWASKVHSDGTSFEGWFILGVTTDEGQISYHLPMSKWEHVIKKVETIQVLDKAPEFDGHTSADVLERLRNL
jgi:hypothetical protein